MALVTEPWSGGPAGAAAKQRVYTMSRFLVPLLLPLAASLAVRAADPLGEPRQFGVARLTSADDTRKKLGLLPDYATNPGLKNLKVAVLDSGFDGADGKRPYLPVGTVVVEHYDKDFVRKFNLGDPEFARPFAAGNAHGRQMAQLVWAMTGNAPDGPQFLLLNANGPTMFRRAIRFAVELKVDVILFSGTFEGAGNFDGRGPINAAVDDAVAAGIIWVNAAGNTGGLVYNGPVDVGPDGFLRFSEKPALRFTNRFDENAISVTLTWNDYRDTEDFGTDKDLDLLVEDAAGRVIGEAKQTQVPPGKMVGENETKNPRERLTLPDLPAVAAGQEYRIRVKAKVGTFGPRDRVRVLLSATKDAPFADPDTGKFTYPVEFLDATHGGEIYPPADHPGVLTVGDGARFSAVGPTADGRVKPDVVLATSVARFSNGEESGGSSNAAAYFAGVVTVLRSREPTLTTGHLREWVRKVDAWNRPVIKVNTPWNAVAPAPIQMPSAFPPGLPVPKSPNEIRAQKYVENTLEEKKKQGQDPLVWMSTPGGSTQVRPAPQVPAPATPQVAPPPATRPEPHAAWMTPQPKLLGELVRGK